MSGYASVTETPPSCRDLIGDRNDPVCPYCKTADETVQQGSSTFCLRCQRDITDAKESK